jgi:hypothetical protein
VLNKCEALSSNPNTAKKKKNVKPFLKNTWSKKSWLKW